MRLFSLRITCALIVLLIPGIAVAAPPAGVTGISAALQNGTVVVNWDPVPDETIAYYRVYYGQQSILGSAGAYDDFEITPGSESTYVIEKPPPVEMLYIAVLAVNEDGEESEAFLEEASLAIMQAEKAPTEPALEQPPLEIVEEERKEEALVEEPVVEVPQPTPTVPTPPPPPPAYDPTQARDVVNLMLRAQQQPNGLYTVIAQWQYDNTSGDLAYYAVRQSRDRGASFSDPEALPIDIAGVQLQDVGPGYFGLSVSTVNVYNQMSPGVFKTIELLGAQAVAPPAPTPTVIAPAPPLRRDTRTTRLAQTGAGIFLASSAAGGIVGWLRIRRRRKKMKKN